LQGSHKCYSNPQQYLRELFLSSCDLSTQPIDWRASPIYHKTANSLINFSRGRSTFRDVVSSIWKRQRQHFEDHRQLSCVGYTSQGQVRHLVGGTSWIYLIRCQKECQLSFYKIKSSFIGLWSYLGYEYSSLYGFSL
jgi:hypothetical protein